MNDYRTGQAALLSTPSGAGANPWLIAILVAVASFMETLDTTIANVLLNYIAGGLGVSEDEASWVVTTYLVANAVSLTASSFLTQRLGRKTFFLICLALFTASSVLCAYASSLNALLLFRIVQGLGGGGMVPVAQSILADAFPPEKRGQGFALFGVAVVVAPVVGPTLGGWLADNLSWRWAFMINGPVGLITMALIAMVLHEPEAAAARRWRRHGERFDAVGFALVVTFLGSLELMLDRGLEDDWFGSTFIVGVAVVLCACIRAYDPVGGEPPQPGDRPSDGGDTPVRRLFCRHAGERGDPARDHPVLAQPRASGFRLYGDLGGPRAVPWRHRHDGDDVRRRSGDHRAVDV